MRKRFGDAEHTIIAQITNRKQRDSEPVQSYVDDMNMLFAQCVLPEAMKLDMLLDNLQPSLKQQVFSTIPKNVEQCVANAIYLQEKSTSLTGGNCNNGQSSQQHQVANNLDAMQRIERNVTRFSSLVSNYPEHHLPQLVGLNRHW